MPDHLARVGFVIISHENDKKLQRLISVLDREFDTPAIAVHHDFHQAPLDRASYREKILWVDDYVRTGWAKWSVVEGTLKAFRLLYQCADVEWFFLLSAADYPVRPGKETRRELAETSVDAFVDSRPLVPGQHVPAEMVGNYNAKLDHFDSTSNRLLKRRFYCSPQWWLPVIRFKPKLRLGKATYRPNYDGNHPFKNGVTCFYGDHWFTANRKAVAGLLEPSSLNQSLQLHYHDRTQPDESYYATMFANIAGLKVCRNNRRYAEWNGGGAHPMTLALGQIPDVIASGAFFARKFGGDNATIEQIDAHLTANKT